MLMGADLLLVSERATSASVVSGRVRVATWRAISSALSGATTSLLLIGPPMSGICRPPAALQYLVATVAGTLRDALLFPAQPSTKRAVDVNEFTSAGEVV